MELRSVLDQEVIKYNAVSIFLFIMESFFFSQNRTTGTWHKCGLLYLEIPSHSDYPTTTFVASNMESEWGSTNYRSPIDVAGDMESEWGSNNKSPIDAAGDMESNLTVIQF